MIEGQDRRQVAAHEPQGHDDRGHVAEEVHAPTAPRSRGDGPRVAATLPGSAASAATTNDRRRDRDQRRSSRRYAYSRARPARCSPRASAADVGERGGERGGSRHARPTTRAARGSSARTPIPTATAPWTRQRQQSAERGGRRTRRAPAARSCGGAWRARDGERLISPPVVGAEPRGTQRVASGRASIHPPAAQGGEPTQGGAGRLGRLPRRTIGQAPLNLRSTPQRSSGPCRHAGYCAALARGA